MKVDDLKCPECGKTPGAYDLKKKEGVYNQKKIMGSTTFEWSCCDQRLSCEVSMSPTTIRDAVSKKKKLA